MQISQILTLYDYNYWANQLILDKVAEVSPQDYGTDRRLSWGGIRGTLVHALSAEWIWRQRCQSGISPNALLAEKDFPTLEMLRTRWAEEEAGMRAWLASLTDADLARVVEYRSTAGKPNQSVLWGILLHLANHGTQHRSELAQVLTELGHSPGDLDLIVYLRQKGI